MTPRVLSPTMPPLLHGDVDPDPAVAPSPMPNPAESASTALNLVALSGNVRMPSRTAVLVRAVAESIASNVRVSRIFLSMADVAPSILGALTRDALGPDGRTYIQQVEAADILVVGSPIYRASYTGALKHLFDLLDYRALTGAVAVIAATAGSTRYALAAEHQFRPMLGSFGVAAVPTAIYALESDFEGTVLTSIPVRNSIERAAEEVASFASIAARRNAACQRAACLLLGGLPDRLGLVQHV